MPVILWLSFPVEVGMEFGYLALYGSGGVIMRRLRARSRTQRPYLSKQSIKHWSLFFFYLHSSYRPPNITIKFEWEFMMQLYYVVWTYYTALSYPSTLVRAQQYWPGRSVYVSVNIFSHRYMVLASTDLCIVMYMYLCCFSLKNSF